jgi:hypothetical protein
MNTLTTITALIAIAIMLSANLNASLVNFNEESYIDDIPFNTECVSANCCYHKAISVEFNFEEEQYIDDIEL